ncbi:alpha/beta fold hydrolase [Duganella callida]|uniref:Alpha/beta hydrolase n=1 Tax=Duganella callida TaxID=2561932 RepID=A0A4Y9SMW5_9BURK|nr:alpha/beta hydrolase [Duganella callida]TFW27980.1 alpha/beta hydrolase [Duganella callida]
MKSLSALLFACLGAGQVMAAADLVEGDLPSGAASLHYWVQGSGAPVVMLSGGPGFASYLHPVMAELAKSGHQAIMLDQRGTGRSKVTPMDATTINADLLVEDLEVLRKHLGLAHWSVLGHSWGGMLAMRYGIAHPDRTDALLLVGSGPMAWTQEFQRYFSDNIHSRLLPSDLDSEAYWNDPERRKADPERANLESLRAILPGYFYNRKDGLAFHDGLSAPGAKSDAMSRYTMKQVAKQDLTEGMQAFGQPVLLLMGRQDPVGETTQYRIRDANRGAQLVFIEKSGHFPWIEQPVAFYGAVNGFLDGSVANARKHEQVK